MKSKICVPDSIASSLQKFLEIERIDLEIVSEQQCDIKIIQCNDRRESNLDTIFSGGWVTCEMARSLAKKMEISLGQMGKMLDHLDVKVRRCSLGCFQ